MKKCLLMVAGLNLFGSSASFAHTGVSSSTAHILEHLFMGASIVALALIVMGFAIKVLRVRNSN